MAFGIDDAIGGGIGTLAGIGTMLYGINQKKKAERAAAANVMPTYQSPQEEAYMMALAQSRANSGLSDAARTGYMANANKGLGTTISAIQRGGGDVNTLGGAYANYEQGINKLGLYDEEARLKNLSAVQAMYARQSANRDKEWQINKYQPWANKAQAIAQQLAGSQNLINSGINTGLSGVANLGKSLFANRQSNPAGGQGSQPSQMGVNGSWYDREPITQPGMLGQGEPMQNNMQPNNNFSFPSFY